MNHPDEALIHDFVDEELTPEQRSRVAAHLADCADCRAIVASARKLREEATRAFADAAEPVPAGQWDRIQERVRAAGAPVIPLPVRDELSLPRSRAGRRAAVAAALFLLAGAGTYAYR